MTPECVRIGGATLWLGDCREIARLARLQAQPTPGPHGGPHPED